MKQWTKALSVAAAVNGGEWRSSSKASGMCI